MGYYIGTQGNRRIAIRVVTTATTRTPRRRVSDDARRSYPARGVGFSIPDIYTNPNVDNLYTQLATEHGKARYMTSDSYIPQPMTTDAEKPQTEGLGGGSVNIALGIDARSLKTDLGKSRWHPSTATGRRWNQTRAAGRCLHPGCPARRYVSPGGFANLRCKPHEAALHRERWAAKHPDYRPYRHRAVGLAALADAVNAD